MSTRSAAIDLAATYLTRNVGGKRAAVFRAISADLADGPAPVSMRLIRDRIRAARALVSMRATKLDAYTARLVADGWLVIVTEADQQAQKPRVWDLGPEVARVYAPVAARRRFAATLAGGVR